jgi:hypothetical protein
VDNHLFPFRIVGRCSEETEHLGNSTDDGKVGDYMESLLTDARTLLKGVEVADETREKFNWGYKIQPEKEEDGHALYRIVDDPLKEDGA